MNNTIRQPRRNVIVGTGAALAAPALLPFASFAASEVAGLEAGLLRRVFGQDHVIAAVAGAIRRAALGTPVKPTPLSFLFLGPRGMGKTHLAKALATQLFGTDDALLRVDLSKEKAIDLTQLAKEAQSRRVILLDEIDGATDAAHEAIVQLVSGNVPPGTTGLRDSVLILTSGANAFGRVVPGMPTPLKQRLLDGLHETVRFRQIDLGMYGITPRPR